MKASTQQRQPRVLISTSSEHGSTAEIARATGDALYDQGVAFEIVPGADGYNLATGVNSRTINA